MSTGYTSEQLHQLKIVAAQNVPPEQTAEQLEDAASATDVVLAGTGKGALITLRFEDGAAHEFFLNCLVALELVTGLLGAAEEQGWRTGDEEPDSWQDLERPTDKRIWDALKIIALRIDSAADGALVSFGTGRTVSQFFMPHRIARKLVAAIETAAGQSGWWAADRQLIPAEPG